MLRSSVSSALGARLWCGSVWWCWLWGSSGCPRASDEGATNLSSRAYHDREDGTFHCGVSLPVRRHCLPIRRRLPASNRVRLTNPMSLYSDSPWPSTPPRPMPIWAMNRLLEERIALSPTFSDVCETVSPKSPSPGKKCLWHLSDHGVVGTAGASSSSFPRCLRPRHKTSSSTTPLHLPGPQAALHLPRIAHWAGTRRATRNETCTTWRVHTTRITSPPGAVCTIARNRHRTGHPSLHRIATNKWPWVLSAFAQSAVGERLCIRTCYVLIHHTRTNSYSPRCLNSPYLRPSPSRPWSDETISIYSPAWPRICVGYSHFWFSPWMALHSHSLILSIPNSRTSRLHSYKHSGPELVRTSCCWYRLHLNVNSQHRYRW